MLKTTPANLMEEIAAAIRHNERFMRTMPDMIRRYHGPDFMEGSEHDFAPENHAYEYISLMLPRLVYDNPRVRVKTRRPGSQAAIAEAMRHGLNRWVRDSRFRNLLTKTCVDMFFNYGVVLTSQGFMPGQSEHEDPRAWPSAMRIPQRWFFRDPGSRTKEECRFFGHRYTRDKEDMVREARENPEAGWNLKVLESWASTNRYDQPGGDGEERWRNRDHVPERCELDLYEMWIPEIRLADSPGPSEGFNGTIYTLGVEQSPDSTTRGVPNEDSASKAAFVREPRPYYGPRWGPYSLFGVYPVPDNAWALSPLAAVHGQNEDLNRHAIAGSNNAAQFKRLVFVDNADPRLVERVKASEDMYVIPVSGLEKAKVIQVEMGGIAPETLQYLQVARDRLDRNSGISDAQRGNVAGEGTATEVAVADNASTARVSFVKQQFTDAVTQVLHTVGWYLYHDDRVDFALGEEAAAALNMEEPWFTGGTFEEDSGATYDDLELEIEPMSMERASERSQTEKTMAMVNTVAALAPVINQFPDLADWSGLMSKLGDAMNMSELDKLINIDAATGQESATAGQPRFNRDVGRMNFNVPDNESVPSGPSEGAKTREGVA